MIPIKTPAEIEKMRASGRAVAVVREALAKAIAPGVTTKQIDTMAGELIAQQGGTSAFLGYRGFPGQICISLNEEVVHGIGGARSIQYGDLVKLDVGIVLGGWIGDTAVSVIVGEADAATQKLCRCTQDALAAGIAQARAGARVRDISAAVEACAVRDGFSVVREFVGHGVGKKLHEEPQIPNYVTAGGLQKLKAGMTLAIEPMINVGEAGVRILADGWTVVTTDSARSAHFEHTVLVTEGEPEILTRP